ncbi:MAG: LTA synthase family protein [Magnetococcus sp. DMHC-6]
MTLIWIKRILYNRYALFVVFLYLYLWIAHPLLEITKGLLRMEVPFLLYLYYCLNLWIKQTKWQAVIAAIPLALLYLIHDYYFLRFFRIAKINDLHQIPELIAVTDVSIVLMVMGLLLVFLYPLLKNIRYSTKGLVWSIPALFVFVAPFYDPSGFIKVYSWLSIEVIYYAPAVNVEYNGRIVTALYNEAKRNEILQNIVQYRDIHKLSLQLPKALEGEEKANGRNIHLILLEGFVDLTLLTKLPEPIHTVHPEFAKLFGKNQGFSVSPVFGGYTAQAEFEVLCGVPAFQEFDVIEYNAFTGSPTYCLPTILKKLGYKSIASQGFKPDFFNGLIAYRGLGFDEIYFAKEYAPTRESYLSKGEETDNKYFADSLLFEQNLSFVKQRLAEKKPFLNFVETVYGHVPFEMGNRVGPELYPNIDLPWDLKRIVNQNMYRTQAVADYVQKLMLLDPYSLIVLFSDHLPPLEGGTGMYAKYGYLTEDVPDRFYKNRFFVIRDGKFEKYDIFYHFNIYRLILDYVTNHEYCKNMSCKFNYPLDKEGFRDDYRIIMGLASQ